MPRSTDPTVGSGELDKRVLLLRPIYNDYQDEIVDYAPATKVWAGIDPSFAQEIDASGRQVETVLISIIIRYRTDIDARWRIQENGHTYEIKGIQDIARRRVRLELSCQEVL